MFRLVVLFTLIAAALAGSNCSGIEPSVFRDALRESACALSHRGGNATEKWAFNAYVQAKHSLQS